MGAFIVIQRQPFVQVFLQFLQCAVQLFAERDLIGLIQDGPVELGTQIAFTCNQPRNFALWCANQPTDNLDSCVESLDKALEHINNTKQLLLAAQCDNSKISEVTRIELGQGSYIDLPGTLYINDFLIPNFYFHMVTAYDILCYKGLDISKPDYMLHLASLVKQA